MQSKLVVCLALLMTAVSSEGDIVEETTQIPTTQYPEFAQNIDLQTNGVEKEGVTNDTEIIQKDSIRPLNILETKIDTGQVVPELETWEAPNEIQNNCRYILSGHDYEGRPIFIAEAGHLNLRKLVQEGGESLINFDRYVHQAAYRGVQYIKKASTEDRPVTQGVIIIDFDDLNLFQFIHLPTLSHVLNMARDYRALVEKICHRFIMVNVNAVASSFLTLVKPIFGNIFERIEIYGNNRARWIPQILKHCPRDQIPEYYGGLKDHKPLKVFG